jgi:UDP-N-acetyl-D-mannosaminuronic acid dehydrogenase
MKSSIEHVCVLGLGYVGLPTASVVATRGIRVTGVDINPVALAKIRGGEVHFQEPDLDVLVRSAVLSGHLVVADTPCSADVFVIAVPTPFRDGHEPDLRHVDAAVRALAPHVRTDDLVILESTCPVGTTEHIGEMLRELRPDLRVPRRGEVMAGPHVRLAHCPERVLPGRVLAELVTNDRVIGGIDEASALRASEFYALFVNGALHTTDCRTAEMCKLAENSFRDVNIAFANELSLICDRHAIDVWELIALANRHPRVEILRPGPGVGGHCVAVDPWFIVASSPDLARLVRCAREVNDEKPRWVVERILAATEASTTVALLGLSFKADVDDLRESPALEVARGVAAGHRGAVLVVEPHIDSLPPALRAPNVELVDLETALTRASFVALLVDHAPFRALDPVRLAGKGVLDTRGAWAPPSR